MLEPSQLLSRRASASSSRICSATDAPSPVDAREEAPAGCATIACSPTPWAGGGRACSTPLTLLTTALLALLTALPTPSMADPTLLTSPSRRLRGCIALPSTPAVRTSTSSLPRGPRHSPLCLHLTHSARAATPLALHSHRPVSVFSQSLSSLSFPKCWSVESANVNPLALAFFGAVVAPRSTTLPTLLSFVGGLIRSSISS